MSLFRFDRSQTEKLPALALVAFAADDRERDNDAVADLQCLFAVGYHLHDLPHELVTHDIAVLHAGHVAVVEMQVGAADRATRHLDDGISRMFDLGIGNLIATYVLGAVRAEGLHCSSPFACPDDAGSRSRRASGLCRMLAGPLARRCRSVNAGTIRLFRLGEVWVKVLRSHRAGCSVAPPCGGGNAWHECELGRKRLSRQCEVQGEA